MDIHQEILAIKERNVRVEADKAWETSWTRRLVIAAMTYIVAVVWLLVINDTAPYPKAFIPTVGYVLSTLSLAALKQRWIGRKETRRSCSTNDEKEGRERRSGVYCS